MTAPFVPLAYFDCWALSSLLRSKTGAFREVRPGHLVLPEVEKAARQMTALGNVIKRLRRHVVSADAEFGAVTLEWLKCRDDTGWRHLDGEWAMAVLPVLTHPGCWVYAGASVPQHIEAGWLTLLGQQPVCLANWGEHDHFVVMTVMLRKKEVES